MGENGGEWRRVGERGGSGGEATLLTPENQYKLRHRYNEPHTERALQRET